jgi:hypothetical protein
LCPLLIRVLTRSREYRPLDPLIATSRPAQYLLSPLPAFEWCHVVIAVRRAAILFWASNT